MRKNSGILAQGQNGRWADVGPQKTIIVTGLARSGTSMVGALLSEAGIYLGEYVDESVFEDKEFGPAFDRNDQKIIQALIAHRNDKQKIWAIKRPHIHVYGPSIIKMFRNPVLIVTMRDPIAIAARNVISEQLSANTCLKESAVDIFNMIMFARDVDCPVLYISYEKAIDDPVGLVDEICNFCGIFPSRAQISRMISCVKPNSPDYYRSSNRRYEGYIDSIENMVLRGWARQINDPSPQSVDIICDGLIIATVIASDYRKDLRETGLDDGRYAFHLDLSAYRTWNESIIQATVSGRTFSLNNSGKTIAQLSGI